MLGALSLPGECHETAEAAAVTGTTQTQAEHIYKNISGWLRKYIRFNKYVKF